MSSKRQKEIRFTKHARDKFDFLRKYGFDVSEAFVKEVIATPNHVERRGNQLLALKPFNREYALRVVYETVNDNIVVVTIYPVKRERFDV